MTVDVSVVIPTIGRPSLTAAIQSVLQQSHPVFEVFVVVDTDAGVSAPDDSRITLLRGGGQGPARCRQQGIDAARGHVIALLDDDDLWCENKIERQLDAVAHITHSRWIVSSRSQVIGPAGPEMIWPRRVIEPGEPIADYLFRKTSLRTGETLLQTSTLCFPIDVSRKVRWDVHAGAAKDEPSWLLRVHRELPGLHVIQLSDALSTYSISGESRSRSPVDRTESYIAWGLEYLEQESPRLLGDYLCTSPISAAVKANSLRSAQHALSTALRRGRPGIAGIAYAALNCLRLAARWRPAKRR